MPSFLSQMKRGRGIFSGESHTKPWMTSQAA
jgi:hypothetical protein